LPGLPLETSTLFHPDPPAEASLWRRLKLKHFADKYLFTYFLTSLFGFIIIEYLALQQVLPGIRENTIKLKRILIIAGPISPVCPIGIISIVVIIRSKHAGIVDPGTPCRRGASKEQ
jgi:hypothetical protein